MLRYILLRVLFMIVTLIFVLTILYFGLNMVQLSNFGPRPKIPFPDNFYMVSEGYFEYIKGIVTKWDFGETQHGNDLWEEFLYRAPITLRIAFSTLFVFVVAGLLLGFISAIKQHTLIDQVIGMVTMIFGSIPPFILMFPLVVVLGYRLEWLPYRGGTSTDPLSHQLLSLVIPIVALSGPAIAQLSRLLRGELVEATNSDFMVLARAKGLSTKQAFFKHALRNSMVPILPEIPSLFIVVLMNAFFIERVYRLNGMANWFLNSMYSSFLDSGYFYIYAPTAILISMFYTAITLITLMVSDILFVIVDPRISLGKRKT
ncbi:MAG: ABC transporter permease [Bacillota bacterium]